ncbi:MAG: hypothetical protein KW788_01035 [Candidatus Doudnabacteria bacterium]|nr:hypothetical protein [Candidatus Doudnabacteria bacterium]
MVVRQDRLARQTANENETRSRQLAIAADGIRKSNRGLNYTCHTELNRFCRPGEILILASDPGGHTQLYLQGEFFRYEPLLVDDEDCKFDLVRIIPQKEI